MKLKKYIILTIFTSLFATSCYGEELNYNNLQTPAEIFYKLGTTDVPETQTQKKNPTIIKNLQNKLTKTQTTTKTLKYNSKTIADLTIKEMSEELLKEQEIDSEDMQSDLSLLWQGTAMKSETIMYAIYKLSNPDQDKPKNDIAKKVLTSVAGTSSLIGACLGNNILTSTSLIGGNTLGIMSQDQKALNYKYSKVNDADLIILVRLIDELQQNLVNSYYDYIIAYKKYNEITNIVLNYKKNYDSSQQNSQNLVLVSDTFYRASMDEQTKARTDFLEKRTKLQQLSGNDTFQEFEKQFITRNLAK